MRRFFRYWLFSNTIISVAAVVTGLILQGTILIYTISGILISYVSILLARRLWYRLKDLNPSRINAHLFWIALFIRMGAVLLLAWVFTHHTGVPFESGLINDDFDYNETSISLAKLWSAGHWELPYYIYLSRGGYSGYPIFVAILMYLTYPTFWVARIANAFLGAGVVALLHRIALICYPQRWLSLLVGVIAVTSPAFIYYSATQHKDMLLCFLGLGAILSLMHILRGSYRLRHLTIIPSCLVALLFIRAAYAAIIISAAFLALIGMPKGKAFLLRGSLRLSWMRGLLGFCCICIAFIFTWNSLGSIERGISTPTRYFESRFMGAQIANTRSMVSTSSYAKYLSYPVYAIGSTFVPTATVVEIPLDTVGAALFRAEYYTIANELVIMSLAPFLILGLLMFISQRNIFLLHIFPFFIFFLYKMVLANSYMILSARHNLPAILISFLIIPLAALPLSRHRYLMLFCLSLLCQIIVMFVFNYVRVQVRL